MKEEELLCLSLLFFFSFLMMTSVSVSLCLCRSVFGAISQEEEHLGSGELGEERCRRQPELVALQGSGELAGCPTRHHRSLTSVLHTRANIWTHCLAPELRFTDDSEHNTKPYKVLTVTEQSLNAP